MIGDGRAQLLQRELTESQKQVERHLPSRHNDGE